MLSPPNSMPLIAMLSLVPLRVGAPVFLNWPSERKHFLHGLPGLGAPGPAPEQPLVEGGDQRGVQSHVGLLVVDPLGVLHGPEHLLLLLGELQAVGVLGSVLLAGLSGFLTLRVREVSLLLLLAARIATPAGYEDD